MLNITLPDGSVRPVESGSTGYALAASISEGLARNALAVRVNGEVRDLYRPFTEDATVEILTSTAPCPTMPPSASSPGMTLPANPPTGTLRPTSWPKPSKRCTPA